MSVETGRYRISLTVEDDAKAHANDSRHCTVAVAVARSIPWATHVDVDVQRIRVLDIDNRERLTWSTPDAAIIAAIRKDEGLPFRPAGFILDETRAEITPMKRYSPRSRGGTRTGGPGGNPKPSSAHRTMGQRHALWLKASTP